MSSPSPVPPQRRRTDAGTVEPATDWPRVWLLVAAGVVASFQVGKAPPALPELRADLGMGLLAAGWVLSLFNLLGVVAGSMIGALAAGWGERRAVLAGLAVVAAASAAGAAAPGAGWLLATRFIEGAGFLVVVIALPALIARAAAPADMKLAFGLWGAYMPVGTATMILLAPWLMNGGLISGFGGWRGLWIANAALVAAMAVILAVATAGTKLARRLSAARPTLSGLRADLRRTVTAAGPLLLAVAFGAYTLQYLALTGFLPTIYGEGGFAPAAAAQLTALVVILNAFGNVVGGALLHRGLPRWALIAAASGFMALSTLVTYADAAFAWRYGACLAFSFVGGLLPTSVLGGAATLTPERRLVPIVNGLVVQGSNIGQVIGPPAVAALAAAAGGWQLSPLVFLVAGTLGVAAALRLRRVERASAPS